MKVIKFLSNKIYLIFYSRIIETKKNIDLFNRLFFKTSEKLRRLTYSIIYAEQPKFLEHEKKSFGSLNPDLTFFVIRLTLGGGIFSNYNNVLYLLKYAEDNNLISVIDYKNYPNYQREPKAINGTKNSWDYFHNQPSDYSLAEVYKSKNVILSNNRSQYYFNKLDFKYFFDAKVAVEKKQLEEMNRLTKKISYNKTTNNFIRNKLDEIFNEKKDVLGVFLRGTDYANKKLALDHYVPLGVEESLELTKEYVEKNNYKYIYLSTEQLEYLELFKREFGERLIYLDRPRWNAKDFDLDEHILEQRFDRKNDRYYTGLEYITDTEGLLRCDHIVGSLTNAFYYILIRNSELKKKVELIDKGLHG
tara:strand:+ start:1071 stop:2153 length:1083 start_codon:yes stop_codon:yes gene_type:complete